ncbi:rab-interacting lysosomal protein isoform X1 [Neophocaena asiaeorientalis asiaeorientalis]|uniref:Rab-interacting lysosomal protein n=1 Tax=Neophocaena asiaeorientalis asiaeorientalis TaxID=1706337 RepID=A0A341AUN0_NEOAA|nr:rab-interacting lysosomal protein isoform X1 [Neophocaena asiaeorientalis asiaeorientalis]
MEPRRVGPGAHCWGPRVAAGSGTAAELVYHLAGALGTELKELARRFGPEAAAGLVPLVVQALELLEKAAVGPAPDSLQVSAQQAELELRQLREENERLCRELRSGPQEERALLRQLKEVTDRQRDELRAHNRDLRQRSQETEALQEQLQRLLLVNAELRHKLAAVQTQLRAARDRESESERRREATLEPAPEQAHGQAAAPGCEQRQEPETAAAGTGAPGTPEDRADALPSPGRPHKVGQCGFSREEVEQILQERNELKANVFLLKEELAYFQRELLTDHRVPGLLLEAMKVAIRKQRRKIKAKMLGTPEEAESRALTNDPHNSSLLCLSDDEDGSWLLLSRDKGDHLQPPPPESRIQSFLGLWCQGGTEAPEAEASIAATSENTGRRGGSTATPVEPGGSLTAPNS